MFCAIGLTGGMGMGKSATADVFRRRGIPVADTDVIAREIVEPGQPALQEIREAFGGEVVGTDGRLKRDELARRIFGDPVARTRLETILHPRIRTIWQQQVVDWRNAGKEFGVVVIPLLFETNAAGSFAATICVACSGATQKQRLLTRGWSEEHIQKRLEAQLPAQKKMDLATFVV